MDFHHGRHHQAYVTNLNNLVKGSPAESQSLEDIIKATYRDSSKTGVFNNAAQVWNHTFFWNCMKPNGGGSPTRSGRPSDRPRLRRSRQVQGAIQGRRGRPVRQRLGLARRRRRQAQDHCDAERGQSARRRSDGAPHLRRLGARLLSRLPEPPAGFRPDLYRSSDQLGLCRPEPRESPLAIGRHNRKSPASAGLFTGEYPCRAVSRCIPDRSSPASERAPGGPVLSRAAASSRRAHEPSSSRTSANPLRDRAEARHCGRCQRVNRPRPQARSLPSERARNMPRERLSLRR